MTTFEAALQNLAAYPRGLVAVCAIIVAIALVWVLTKVLKWTLYLAAFLAIGCCVVVALAWWLG
ncbi:MAG TPA: hypothetical protein VHF69_01660 [Candidatus Synoicihabitans sp.]|nr:hypothetical protein [Candidatus Synoicihabitans sp.]